MVAKGTKSEGRVWKEIVAFLSKVKHGKAVLTKDARYTRFVINAGENKVGRLPAVAGEVFLHKGLKELPDRIRLVMKEGK